MFKLHPVLCGPPGVDGLFSDETMAPAPCTLMDPVHSAFVNSTPLIVMVWHNTVIGMTGMREVKNGNDGLS